MKSVYFYNRGEFEQRGMCSWTDYETFINTAKDIQSILAEKSDYETLKNIKETLERVMKFYDDLSGLKKDRPVDVSVSAGTYRMNLGLLKDDVVAAMVYYEAEKGGWQGRGYYKQKGYVKNYLTRINTKLRDMVRGVVYDGARAGNHFFHIFNPEQDIYTYKGRDFYMWDGWHSSLKVMKEIADRELNN